MKLQTVSPAVLPTRCSYRSASGRQCRLSIFDPQSGLCANHHADLKQNERADVANILFRDAQDFQTPQDINYSLRCLYWLASALTAPHGRDRKAGITYVPNPPEPNPTKKPS